MGDAQGQRAAITCGVRAEWHVRLLSTALDYAGPYSKVHDYNSEPTDGYTMDVLV